MSVYTHKLLISLDSVYLFLSLVWDLNFPYCFGHITTVFSCCGLDPVSAIGVSLRRRLTHSPFTDIGQTSTSLFRGMLITNRVSAKITPARYKAFERTSFRVEPNSTVCKTAAL